MTALVIFDCDGTLVDSAHAITAAMQHAFRTHGLAPPERPAILEVVGLSLPEAFAAVAADQPPEMQRALADVYRSDFLRVRGEISDRDVLYPGAKEAVEALAGRDRLVLGIATGKSRRGVARLLAQEGWEGYFRTIQTADDHPSKPHPSMILTALGDAAVGVEAALMVGDTTYDMEMARSAGVGAIGVEWGYHASHRLTGAGAHAIADDFPHLMEIIGERLVGRSAGT